MGYFMVMRLSSYAQKEIVQAAHDAFGAPIRVLLFGSRLRSEAKGGDIDLLVESPLSVSEAVAARWRFRARLAVLLGESSVDVVVSQNVATDARRVVVEALREGVYLC